MNAKKLVILLAVFILAIALFGILQFLEKDGDSIIKESGYEDIAPSGFLKADVAWFEVWRGGKEDKKVIVNRKEDSWRVGSRFDAPADNEKVDTFLGLYKGLMGTVRSTSKDILSDYNLKDDQAVHVKIVMQGDKKEPLEFLVGKESKFARKKGDNKVYSIDRDFNKVLGVHGDTDTPGSTQWLKKKILAIDKEKITKVTVAYPDKELVFEKTEKKDEFADKKKDKDGIKPEKKKEYEWKIISGAPEGLKAKSDPAKKILEKLGDLECSDVVDPKDKEKWGLADPQFRIMVTKEDKSTVEIAGGLTDAGSSGYVMLSGAPHVYELSNWVFKNMFPSGGDLFDNLPKRPAKKEEIVKVTVTNFKGQTFAVVQKDKGIKKKDDKESKDEKTAELLSPDISLEAKESELKDIISGINELEAEDFSSKDPNSDLIGIAKPSASVEIILKDGKKTTIKVGNRSKTITGYYMTFGDGKVYSGAEYKVEKVFPELKDLFKKDLVKAEPDKILSVKITSSTETVELERTDKGWKGKEGGKEFEVDEKAVKDYLGYFNSLSIEDIAQKEAEGKPVTVELVLKEEGKKNLSLRKGKDTFTVVSEGQKGIFTVDKMTYERAAALFVKFKKEKPETVKKEEAKEEKKGTEEKKESLK